MQTLSSKNNVWYIRAGALSLVALLAACGNLVNPPTRLGMVKNTDTGLMFGSVISDKKTLMTDPSFYKNKKIKVRVRNTSGDTAFNLKRFGQRIGNAYKETGYIPTTKDDFGLLLDLNVIYSGQVQTNLSQEFGFLGGAAGGIAGIRSKAAAGTVIGVVAGATLGDIIGSFITDDTYIIIAKVGFARVVGGSKKPAKTITFSRSFLSPEEKDKYEEKRRKRGMKKAEWFEIAVYAGGRNVSQSEIAEQVRQRMVRIVGDIT